MIKLKIPSLIYGKVTKFEPVREIWTRFSVKIKLYQRRLLDRWGNNRYSWGQAWWISANDKRLPERQDRQDIYKVYQPICPKHQRLSEKHQRAEKLRHNGAVWKREHRYCRYDWRDDDNDYGRSGAGGVHFDFTEYAVEHKKANGKRYIWAVMPSIRIYQRKWKACGRSCSGTNCSEYIFMVFKWLWNNINSKQTKSL